MGVPYHVCQLVDECVADAVVLAETCGGSAGVGWGSRKQRHEEGAQASTAASVDRRETHPTLTSVQQGQQG